MKISENLSPWIAVKKRKPWLRRSIIPWLYDYYSFPFTSVCMTYLRKYNPSATPISTLICIYGVWWQKRLVFEDKPGSEAQYDNL